MALGKGNIEIDIKGNVDTAGIARQVTAAEKQIRPLNLSLNDKGFRQPLGRISGDLAEFQKSLDASVARTLAFGAAVGVINSVSDGFSALIESAVEVERALTDINVILNLNAEALAQFSTELFETATNTGQSFQTVAEAAVELSRQGLGAEETLNRINDAMILTRLSGMDAAKSVETLTAAVNSFGDTALTTTDLVNKLATVDAAFAVSTEDLANALARSGASAQAAKVDLNELLAAVTSVQQTTARGGSVIGNAFKSIFTRLQRSGVREALEEIGVATTDAAGNIRGALDILQDYSGVYGTLTDAQRAYTDELVAGVFQINNLRALVKDLGSDYSIYNRALEQSNGATDEAIRRNEQLQSTLSALINEAAVNAKELAATLGDLVATPAIENLLNIFNSISGALKNALDPEQGSSLIQGLVSGIGKFLSGPGLIIIGAAFIKLFKFITQQSLKAVSEIFKIGSAANNVADAEAKIGFLLKNNKALYEAISNEALTHEQREDLVLRSIKEQNAAYQQQQALISRLAGARSVQSAVSVASKAQGFVPQASKGYVPNFAKGTQELPQKPKAKKRTAESKAAGFIPNFANGLEGAIQAEKQAVSSGVGGASRTAKPTVLKNFPMGGGKHQTIVANTDEVIVPNFGGGAGSAIFNQDMIKQFGMPDGAMPVYGGFIPNFAKSFLDDPKSPFQELLNSYKGVDINVQKDLSGFGMLSAKGSRGNLSVTKKPGFDKKEKIELINSIGGSKLKKDDVDFLLSTIGSKKKTRFSNIPSQTIESADPKQVRGKVGALDNIINPYIADAVANVATTVYTKVLGDEVSAQNLIKNVRSSANVDKGIVSVGAQGDIFESAIRLGSQESAKGLGRDNRNAIWDFEEKGSISSDLKSLFFPSSSIVKADAKRSGDQTSATEVVEKAYKDTFPEQLKRIYASNWAPLVDAATKLTPAKSKTERKRTGRNLAGGYIPNFITSIPTEAIKPFQASQYTDRMIMPAKENDKMTQALISELKPEKAYLKNPKEQKADLNDLFKALIDVEYDKRTNTDYEKISNPISQKLIKGNTAWLDRIGKSSSLVKKGLADPSSLQSIRTQLRNIKLLEEIKKKGINERDIIAGKKETATLKQKNYWKKYGEKDGKGSTKAINESGKLKNLENLKNGIPIKVKGLVGEFAAAVQQGTTVNRDNSYFDLASGKEVKTTRSIDASNLLKKGVNKFLTSRSTFNKKPDKIGLDKISVIMPKDGRVNFAQGLIPEVSNQIAPAMNFDSGFIPNFVGNKIKWDIDRKTNDYSLSGSETDLRIFGEYLKQVSGIDQKIVTPTAVKIFEERLEKVRFEKTQEDKDFKSKNKIGFGRQGAKYHSGREAVRDKDRKISTKGLFIKGLGEHVKNHNRNGIFAAKDAPLLFNKAHGHIPNFIEGFVPNFANQVFDADRMPRTFSNQILQDILESKKKKDLIIGPSGAGKSTIASRYGEFIQGIEDVEEATSFTLLSGSGKTKSGGLSPSLLKIIDSVNETGGKISYLSAKDKDIASRREQRIKKPASGDARSVGQLKGTRHAPLNQKGFPEMVKKAANRFEILTAGAGYIPNFALPEKDFAKFSTAISRFNAKNAISPPLKASSPRELFKIPKKDPQVAEETAQNIRQFISSDEYGFLNGDTQKQIKKFYNTFSARTGLSDPTREFTKYESPEFEGRIAAAKGFMPNFIDDTISSLTSKTKPTDATREFTKYEDPGLEVGPTTPKGFAPKAIEKTIRERSIEEDLLTPENKSSKKFSAISKFVESAGIQDSQLFSHQPSTPEQRDNNLEKRKQFLDAAKGMVPNFAKDKKQAYVFDFDDTLAVTQAKGFKDFSDPKFVESAEATRYSSLARRRARLGDDIHVLTARIGSKGITSAISDFMKNIGAPAKSVIGVADMFRNEKEEGAKPGKMRKMGTAGKKSKILSQLSKKYEAITFLDDSRENILKAQEVQGVKAIQAKKDKLFKADGLIPNFALTSSMIKGLQSKLKPGSGATEAEKKTAREKLQKEGIISDDKIRGIKDAAILGDLKFSRKQVQNAIADVVDKRNRLELDPQPIEVDTTESLRFASEYIKKVNSNKSSFLNEKIFDTPLNTAEVSMALKGQGGYKRGKYFPEKIVRNTAEGYIPHFIQPKEKDSPENVKSYISGYIPNFADALQQAIAREKDALKSQGSSAKVYVDKDKRLKSSKNPMGLLVANKRDEPGGGFQGVNRAMSTGLDPKTHGMASGYIPNFATQGALPLLNPAQLKSYKEQQKANLEIANSSTQAAGSLEKQSEGNQGVEKSAASSVGKMLGIQIALTTAETALVQTGVVAEDFSLKFTQLGFAFGEGADTIGDSLEGLGGPFEKIGGRVKSFAGAIAIASTIAGAAADIYSNFIDPQKKLIRELDKEIKVREEALNIISQNIEKIDKFATATARFSQAAEAGKVETAGKFMQELFNQAKNLTSLDPKAFEDVLNSIGDTEKLNKAIAAFKQSAEAGKNLKVVEKDFSELIKTVTQKVDSEQFLGIFGGIEDIDFSQFENDIKAIGTTLTKNLSDQQVLQLSDALKGFNTQSGNSGEKILQLQSIFGKFNGSTQRLFSENEKVTSSTLEQIKQQAEYAAAVIKAKEAFEIAQKPIEKLNSKLSQLGNQLIATAQNTSSAIDLISQTGKIEAASNLQTLQATGTVTQEGLVAGQAAADIKNAIARSAKEQEVALQSFAGEVIKGAQDGTTKLDDGVKNLIAGIDKGNISNEAAIKGLIEVQKTGSPEQKDAATKTIEELRKINQSTIKDTAVTNANLRSQLNAIKAQAIDFQRNTQLSESQLANLGNINDAFKNNKGLLEGQLTKLTEVKASIELMEKLGADSEILAELKEQNRKSSQFENLQSAFEQITGQTSESLDLEQLNNEIYDFDLSQVENETAQFIQALNEAVAEAVIASKDEGVKGQEDVERASLVTFSSDEVNNLSMAMGQAVSDSLASALGIGPELASEINKAVDVNLVARAIEELATKNAGNALSNAETMKELNQALVNSLQEADFGASSNSLEKAADSLERAAKTIESKFGSAAEGFVPNYAPTSGIQKALHTERKMGGKKPVLDSHPSVGAYVRDAATQPNFAAVKRDHPEGLNKASKNSRAIQEFTKARGFVPNFAESFFGGELGPQVDFKNLESSKKGKGLLSKGKDILTLKDSKVLDKIKNIPKPELAKRTLSNAGKVLKGGAVGLGGKAISALTEYFVGDISVPSDARLVESMYYGSKKGRDVPRFVDGNGLSTAMHWLDKNKIAETADSKIASAKAYLPNDLDPLAIKLSKNKFDQREKELFDLSRSRIPELKAWSSEHARDAWTTNLLSDISDWSKVTGDWLGIGSGVALTVAPATGPAAPITAAVGLAAGGGSLVSYGIGSAADILNYYLDTGMTTDQVEGLSESTLTPKLEQAMPTIFKKKSPNSDLFPVSARDAATQVLKSEPTNVSISKALEEITKGGYFTLDANQFLNGKTGGGPRLKIDSKGRQADVMISKLAKEYKAIRENPDNGGIYDFSKKLVEENVNGSPNFFANLSKIKGFEETLGQDDNFKLKLPLSFGTETSDAPTLWSSEDLGKSHHDLTEKIQSQEQQKLTLGQTIENLKSDQTDPNREVKLEDAQKEMEVLNSFINQNKSNKTRVRDLKAKFDFSRDYFNKNKGDYDRFDGTSLFFPSPTNQEDVLKLRLPEPPAISDADLPKDFSINGYSQLSSGAAEAITQINNQQTDSINKIKGLLALDFSDYMQSAALLRPQGVSNGIDKATEFLSEQTPGVKMLGFKIGEKEKFGAEISQLKEEKRVIDKFDKGEALGSQDAEIAQNIFGNEGLDAADKIKQQEKELKNKQNNIRDALYLQTLGKRAEGFMAEDAILEARSRINRINDKKAGLTSALDGIIAERERRLQIISDRPQRSGDNEIIQRFNTEKQAAQQRKELYNSAQGNPFLYFTNGIPQEINGVRMPAPIWESDENHNEKFKKIQQVIKMQEQGVGLGKFVGDMANIDLLAMMRDQPLNNGALLGAEFEDNFGQANVEQRRAVLERLGLVSQKMNQNQLENLFNPQNFTEFAKLFEIKKQIIGNLTSLSGDNSALGFLAKEVLYSTSETDKQAMFIKALQGLDIPFSPTSDVTDYLKNKQVSIEHGSLGEFSVPALEGTDIEGAKVFTSKFQVDDFSERAAVGSDGAIADQISKILGQASIEDLNKNPVFVQDNNQLLANLLKNNNAVANIESWQKKYGAGHLQTFKEKLGVAGYGELDVSSLSNDQTDKFGFLNLGNISEQLAAKTVIGNIDHGKNQLIEDLLANSTYPFPQLNVENWAERHEAAKSKILSYYKDSVNETYAPFGYAQGNDASDTPDGMPEKITELFKILYTTPSVKQTVSQAKGFVPNFSAVAGEIAASKTAGYKNPVTPSQVKTMDIPGIGKTAYNTQESVFKMPGTTQPFIVPPSSSEAAKPYAREVQKKYNFNPYKKTAADGFVPNFQKGMDFAAFESAVSTFSNIIDSFNSNISSFDGSVGEFNSKVGALNFKEFGEASRSIAAAAEKIGQQASSFERSAQLLQTSATLFSQQNNQGQDFEVDFSPVSTAANTISSSMSSLASKLNVPLEINSQSIVDAMNSLNSALGSINGKIDVRIPNVSVNVNGGNQISSSIEELLKRDVPKLVAAEIQKLNLTDDILNYIS